MSTNKSSGVEDSGKSHGGHRKGAGRKPGRSFVTRAIAVKPDDVAKWTQMAKIEGVSLSQWIRERCGEVSGVGLIRAHERMVELVADRGGDDPTEEFAEWRELAVRWLATASGETREVRSRLAGLDELVGR